jgi:hypothetical protein
MALAARLPEDDCQQVDTSALRPSTPPGSAARSGRDAAHAE